MRVYLIYCPQCGKMLGATVNNLRAQCAIYQNWILVKKSEDSWIDRKENQYGTWEAVYMWKKTVLIKCTEVFLIIQKAS